jgi:hypothetical protein
MASVSFLHRFGSALNHHVHLHACATDGVFMPIGDGPPAFLPARPITHADRATLTKKVRRRVVRWFHTQRLLDADAAADRGARGNSGFSADASARITLIDRDVPSYFQSLENLLRWWVRHRRLLRLDSKAPLPRLLADRVGETAGAGGGGVSFCVPGGCGGDIRLLEFRLLYECKTIPDLRTLGTLRLLRTSCPRAAARPTPAEVPPADLSFKLCHR